MTTAILLFSTAVHGGYIEFNATSYNSRITASGTFAGPYGTFTGSVNRTEPPRFSSFGVDPALFNDNTFDLGPNLDITDYDTITSGDTGEIALTAFGRTVPLNLTGFRETALIHPDNPTNPFAGIQGLLGVPLDVIATVNFEAIFASYGATVIDADTYDEPTTQPIQLYGTITVTQNSISLLFPEQIVTAVTPWYVGNDPLSGSPVYINQLSMSLTTSYSAVPEIPSSLMILASMPAIAVSKLRRRCFTSWINSRELS